MATEIDLARGWMQKGDSDSLDAERTTLYSGPYDTACFHTQQAVEKYLKAILALSGTPVPRMHDRADLHGHSDRSGSGWPTGTRSGCHAPDTSPGMRRRGRPSAGPGARGR